MPASPFVDVSPLEPPVAPSKVPTFRSSSLASFTVQNKARYTYSKIAIVSKKENEKVK